MAKVRAKNTKPELALRKYLHAKGLRFRIHDRRFTGSPDLVFLRARIAVFVDGDFWHGAGWKERGLKGYDEQFPSRRDWWVAKIARNIERDCTVNQALESQGWMVMRVFASQLSSDLPAVARRILAQVRRRSLAAYRQS
jgi:DNA mismatch endonuclease (patch repair protein)